MIELEQQSIGLVAGSGTYPLAFLAAARRHAPGVKIATVGFEGETQGEVRALSDRYLSLRVGQLSKLIQFFREEGVSRLVMVGQITPGNLFELKPDWRVLSLLARLPKRNAETLFGAVADELKREGITVLPATTYLEDHLPEPGHLAGPKLKARQWQDLEFGYNIAKEVSRLDIGQTVLVRHGTVLAVEGFEGTNACIRRGGELGRGRNVTLVKVSKPNQDFRFDVPVIGPQTISTCLEARVEVLGIEARRTLVLNRDEVLQLCSKHRLSLYALGEVTRSTNTPSKGGGQA